MNRKHLTWRTSFLIALTLGIVTSCSSNGASDTPTTPGGGGGGGTRELDSGTMAPGDTYQHRFAVAGAYQYRCLFHSPMTGLVEVDTGAADTLVLVSIISSSQPFPAAAVKPGGRVVWTNNTSTQHTVTSP